MHTEQVELEKWTAFYKKYFSIEIRLEGLVIPSPPQEGSWKLLIIAQGLRIYQIANGFKKVRIPADLDMKLKHHARIGEIFPYSIWVCLDEDPAYCGKSADEADPNGEDLTLIEGIILHLAFAEDTGNFLEGITICSGSRCADGSVPYIFENKKRAQIGLYRSDYSYPKALCRKAV